jgi:hypothetical protein
MYVNLQKQYLQDQFQAFVDLVTFKMMPYALSGGFI